MHGHTNVKLNRDLLLCDLVCGHGLGGFCFDSDVEIVLLSEDVVLSGQMWPISMV